MNAIDPGQAAQDRHAVLKMIGGFSATQILFAAAKLRIVDLVNSGQSDLESLASSLGVPEDRLGRFLRMLVVVGILEEDGYRRFGVTGRGALLASDSPSSLLDRIIYVGEISYEVSRHIEAAVKTGTSAFEIHFGAALFEHLALSPENHHRFDKLMACDTKERIRAILSAYDFSRSRELVDIGGGSGELVTGILERYPHLEAVIFDLPDVVSRTKAHLDGDVGSRIRLVAGDIFIDHPPSDADAYLLSNILHDWDDARSIDILTKCHNAAGEGGHVLVITELLPERVTDAPATIANDFSMLMLTSGRERTLAEYTLLLDAAGLHLLDVRPLRLDNGRRENWVLLVAQ